MSTLLYKTQNNVSPYGKPKVYFCCHPDDFDMYFEEISDEVLAKQRCSVWYHHAETITYDEMFFEDLSQMQMFVIPITSRFLRKGNPALDIEFHFAVSHHIPVLPLMQERGLEALFNEICGELQFLDKYSEDDSAIRYEDKLDKFLSSVLIGEELAEKIRDAFDAYVFLSYRKKDRRYAQELMRLIHKNDFCRDIAIWYDEFLIPGENFNDAIQDAILKSDLFVLAVTPNLVNEKNYIMTVEYPMAKDKGKKILPAEMVDTNKELLEQNYADLPSCTNARDDKELASVLYNLFGTIARKETDSSPEHLFFIGLAYLNGVDVEVDRSRALSLITTAAEGGLQEAVRQLISMYANGDGVKIDMEKVLYWQQRLVEITHETYLNNTDFEHAHFYIDACYDLGVVYYRVNRYEEAEKCLTDLTTACIMMKLIFPDDEYASLNLRRYEGLAYSLLGKIAHTNLQFENAKDYFEKAIRLGTGLNEEVDSPLSRSDLSYYYRFIAQLYKVRGEIDKAIEYCEQALELQQINTKYFDEPHYYLQEVYILRGLAELYRLKGDFERSKECCLNSLSILDRLMKAKEDHQYITSKCYLDFDLVEVYRTQGEFGNALLIMDEILSLEERYYDLYQEQLNDISFMRLSKTAQIYFQLRDYEQTIKYGEAAVKIREEYHAINDEEVATGNCNVPAIYNFIGISYTFRYDYEKAEKNCRKAMELVDDYATRGIIANIPDYVMAYASYSGVLQEMERMDEAEAVLKKAIALLESYHFDSESYRDVAACYTLNQSLGILYATEEKYDDAIGYLKKAEEWYAIACRLLPSGIEQFKQDYASLCNYMGYSYWDKDKSVAKEYFQKTMEVKESIPESERILDDWELLGMTYLNLYSLSGILSRRKWEKKVFYVSDQLEKRFPMDYSHSRFYKVLKDIGVVE